MTAGARWALREATAEAHARLDAAMDAFDLAAADGYRRFLQVHAEALPALEAAVAAAGRPWSGWAPRAPFLHADLAELGAALPGDGATLAPALSPGAAWGVQYVLEGSRLGGRVLVARLAPEAPRRYLAAPAAPGGWAGFLRELEAGLAACGPGGPAEAQAGAEQAFARFSDAVDARRGPPGAFASRDAVQAAAS